MTIDNKSLIIHATQHLKLRDIILEESKFLRPASILESDVNVVQQHMRGSEFVIGEPLDQESEVKTLRVLVTFGVRIASEELEPKVVLSIEASYVVIYDITGELLEDHFNAFAEFNVIHNVWPFWRQHVFDIVQRGKLPMLDIPLFAGISM